MTEPAALPHEHSFAEWEDSDGTFRCTLTMQMPGGAKRAFGGSGVSAARARHVAAFYAKMALMKSDLASDSDASDSEEGSSCSDDDADIAADPPPPDASSQVDMQAPDDPEVAHVPNIEEPVFVEAAQDIELVEAVTEPEAVEAEPPATHPLTPGDAESQRKVESDLEPPPAQSRNVAGAASATVELSEEDDDLDDEHLLSVMQAQLASNADARREDGEVEYEEDEISPNVTEPDRSSGSPTVLTSPHQLSETVHHVSPLPRTPPAVRRAVYGRPAKHAKQPKRTRTHSPKPGARKRALSSVAPPSHPPPSSPHRNGPDQPELRDSPQVLSVSDSDSPMDDRARQPSRHRRTQRDYRAGPDSRSAGAYRQPSQQWTRNKRQRTERRIPHNQASAGQPRELQQAPASQPRDAAWNDVPRLPGHAPVPIPRRVSTAEQRGRSPPRAVPPTSQTPPPPQLPSRSQALGPTQLPLPLPKWRSSGAGASGRPGKNDHSRNVSQAAGSLPQPTGNGPLEAQQLPARLPMPPPPMPPAGMPGTMGMPYPDPRYAAVSHPQNPVHPTQMPPHPMMPYMPQMPMHHAAPYAHPMMPGAMPTSYPFVAPPPPMPMPMHAAMPYPYAQHHPQQSNVPNGAPIGQSRPQQNPPDTEHRNRDAPNNKSVRRRYSEPAKKPGRTKGKSDQRTDQQKRRKSCPEDLAGPSDENKSMVLPKVQSEKKSRRSKNIPSSSAEQPGKADPPAELSDEEEQVGEDHVSRLNLLAQKSAVCKDVKYSFDDRASKKGSPSGVWVCEVSCKILLQHAESDTLTKVGRARTRKMAKHNAAKHAFSAISSMLPSDTERRALSKSMQGAPEKRKGTSSAIGALNQMFHWSVLESFPDYNYADTPTNASKKWECTAVARLRDSGLIKETGLACSKKGSKAAAAFKVLERLRELKVDRIDVFDHLVAVVPDSPEEEVVEEEDAEAVKNAVQVSDDENDGKVAYDGRDIDFEGLLVLPKEYEVAFATGAQQCQEWMEQHVKPNSDLGVFIDSWSARSAFGDLDAVLPERAIEKYVELEKPLLCFSTKTNGLVVRADMCMRAKSVKEPLIVDGFWMPDAVLGLLEDKHVRKHGVLVDDGIMRLWKLYKLRIDAVHDVAGTAYGITGLRSPERKRIFWSLPELTKHWLHKEFIGCHGKEVWANVKDAPAELTEPSSKENQNLATGLLSAYASICVQEQVDLFANNKMTQRYGSAGEFLELSKRLMQDPFDEVEP